MKLRCKEGQRAITFGAPLDNGLVVEVLHAVDTPAHIMEAFGPCWRVRSLGSPFHITPEQCSMTAVWPDRMLIPLGRPSEGAIDETLLLAGVPKREGQPV